MALHRGKDAEGPPIARYSKSSWLTRGDTEVKMLEGESPRIIKLDRTAILHPSLAMTLRDGTQVEWSVSLFSRSFECKTNDQQVIAGLRTSSVNDAEIYVRADHADEFEDLVAVALAVERWARQRRRRHQGGS